MDIDWIERLSGAPGWLLALTAALGLFSLYNGFAGLRRTRLIEDVPTARVRSAPQAYVELEGQAHALAGEPMTAPASQTPCCWYRYKVERRSGKEWRTTRSEVSDGLFLLRDPTGDCVIDPEGAEVTTMHTAIWMDDGDGWGAHGVHQRHDSLGRLADTMVWAAGRLFDGIGTGRYRHTEAVILDGDPLYAIGSFRSLGTEERIGTLHDQVGAILRDWKKQPETLRERFDRNRDGQIDQHEWDRARRAARQEARRERVQLATEAQVHTLARPGDGRFFLLSNLAEFGLLRRYRWQMRLGFLGFLCCGAAMLVMTGVGR